MSSQLVVTAPFGAVSGSVTLVGSGASLGGGNTTLASWGFCQPPAASASAGRRAMAERSKSGVEGAAAAGLAQPISPVNATTLAVPSQSPESRAALRSLLKRALAQRSPLPERSTSVPEPARRPGASSSVRGLLEDIEADFVGAGVAVNANGVAAVDPAMKIRIVFTDQRRWVNATAAQLPAGVSLARGLAGPDDTSLDEFGYAFAVVGCQPGLDFYTVVRIEAAAHAARFVSWSLTSAALGGASIANSGFVAAAAAAEGNEGSGYTPSETMRVWHIERWCAPSRAALAGAVAATLRTDSAAAGSMGPAGPSALPPVSMIVVTEHRCRIAPRWPGLYWQFPAPGGSLIQTVPSFVIPCGASDEKELAPDPTDPSVEWSLSVLKVLGTPQGADFSGFFTSDAVEVLGPADTACRNPDFVPVVFMVWFPEGFDSVAWRVQLITRQFDYLGISGPNPLSLGIVTQLASYDDTDPDGLNEVSAASRLELTNAHGEVQKLCMSPGLYELSAKQAREGATAKATAGTTRSPSFFRFTMLTRASLHSEDTSACLCPAGSSAVPAGAIHNHRCGRLFARQRRWHRVVWRGRCAVLRGVLPSWDDGGPYRPTRRLLKMRNGHRPRRSIVRLGCSAVSRHSGQQLEARLPNASGQRLGCGCGSDCWPRGSLASGPGQSRRSESAFVCRLGLCALVRGRERHPGRSGVRGRRDAVQQRRKLARGDARRAAHAHVREHVRSEQYGVVLVHAAGCDNTRPARLACPPQRHADAAAPLLTHHSHLGC